MRRALDLIGSKVLHVGTGQLVGKVADLVFDRQGVCQGLVLEKQYWFVKPAFIPISHILSIGEDVITLHSIPELNSDYIQEEWIYLSTGQPKIKGTPLITSTGKQLGMLQDVYFQTELGTIIGYEVSDGFFADLLEGRQIIKKPKNLMIGKDAFIISEEESRERLQ